MACKYINICKYQSAWCKSNTVAIKCEHNPAPVVHCKNCKYYTDNINDPNLRKGFCNRVEMNCFDKRLPDDYCSYGIGSDSN